MIEESERAGEHRTGGSGSAARSSPAALPRLTELRPLPEPGHPTLLTPRLDPGAQPLPLLPPVLTHPLPRHWVSGLAPPKGGGQSSTHLLWTTSRLQGGCGDPN